MRSNLLALLVVVASGHKLRHTAKPSLRKSYRQRLHNENNVQYFADLQIGQQKISGIFDTGSFELLVRSSSCQACEHPTTPYFHEKSSTYRTNGTLSRHVFGSGPCITKMGYETVAVGPDMIAENQSFFEIIQHEIPVMNTAKFAAIVGIGPNYGFSARDKTLLMNFGVEEFSICLDKKKNEDGYLTWGPEAKALKSSQMKTAKVIGEHHWATPLTDVSFGAGKKGDHHLTLCSDPGECVAIVDSGTSLIAGPTDALDALLLQIGEIKEDCSNVHLLPSLRFNLDGKEFELPPQAYVMRMTGAMLEDSDIGIWDILFTKPKIKMVNSCTAAFMKMDMPSEHGHTWILGMPFFRYYHTTFDRSKQEMRFARAGKNCEPNPIEATKVADTFAAFDVDAESFKPLDVEVRGLIPPRVIMEEKSNMVKI